MQDIILQNEFTRLVSHEKTSGFNFTFWQKVIELKHFYNLPIYAVQNLKNAANFVNVEDDEFQDYTFHMFLNSSRGEGLYNLTIHFTDGQGEQFKYSTIIRSGEISNTIDYFLDCL